MERVSCMMCAPRLFVCAYFGGGDEILVVTNVARSSYAEEFAFLQIVRPSVEGQCLQYGCDVMRITAHDLDKLILVPQHFIIDSIGIGFSEAELRPLSQEPLNALRMLLVELLLVSRPITVGGAVTQHR